MYEYNYKYHEDRMMNYNNYIRSEWALHSQSAVYASNQSTETDKCTTNATIKAYIIRLLFHHTHINSKSNKKNSMNILLSNLGLLFFLHAFYPQKGFPTCITSCTTTDNYLTI